MPENFTGTVQFMNSSEETIVIIDPDALPTPIVLQDALGNRLMEITVEALLSLGGAGFAGDISLRLADGSTETIHLSAGDAAIQAGGGGQDGLLVLRNAAGDRIITASAAGADLAAGGRGTDADVVLYRAAALDTEDPLQSAVRIQAEDASVEFRNDAGQIAALIEGEAGNIRLGGTPQADGDLLLFRHGAGIDIHDAAQAAIHANGDNARVTFRSSEGNYVMRLDGDGGNIRAGGAPGVDGDLLLYRSGANVDIDDASQAAIHLNAGGASAVFRDAQERITLRVNGNGANIYAGGTPNADGDLVLFRHGEGINNTDANQSAIHASGAGGTVVFRNAAFHQTLRLEGDSGNIRAGGPSGVDGDLLLFRAGRGVNINNAETATIHADAGSSTLTFRDGARRVTLRLEGDGGNIRAGGTPTIDGDLVLFRAGSGINIDDVAQSAIHADAGAGTINFRNPSGLITLRFEGNSGNIRAGGAPGVDGDLVLFRSGSGIDINDADQAAIFASADGGLIIFRDSAGQQTARFEGDSGNLRLGGAPGVDGDVVIFPSGNNIDINDASQATIHLNGDSGDIILRNADCAEEFAIANAAEISPGTVMVLGDSSELQASSRAYDKRVVGVISGAGAYKPGLVLDKQPGALNRKPVALMGKVYCQVTAESAPVEVGDLLTTSDLTGYAMKASDPARAFGAVIGKALQPLKAGRGLIPVLIALQ